MPENAVATQPTKVSKQSPHTGDNFFDDEYVSSWIIKPNEAVNKYFSGAEQTKSKGFLADYTLNAKNPLEMPGLIKSVHFSVTGVDGGPVDVNTPAVMTELRKLIAQTHVTINKATKPVRKMRVEEYCEALPLIGTASSTINPYRKSAPLNLPVSKADEIVEFIARLADGDGAYRPTAAIENYCLRMHLSVRLFTFKK